MRWFKWFGKDYSAEAMKKKALVADVMAALSSIDAQSIKGCRVTIIRHGIFKESDKVLENMGYSVESDGDGNSIIRW